MAVIKSPTQSIKNKQIEKKFAFSHRVSLKSQCFNQSERHQKGEKKIIS